MLEGTRTKAYLDLRLRAQPRPPRARDQAPDAATAARFAVIDVQFRGDRPGASRDADQRGRPRRRRLPRRLRARRASPSRVPSLAGSAWRSACSPRARITRRGSPRGTVLRCARCWPETATSASATLNDVGAGRAAHLPGADARQHARGVVHLGHQHDLPAGRGALEPGGVRGQRALLRRDGAVRGADRDRGRRRRAARLLPARHGHADALDAAVRLPVGGRGGVLGVGDRVDPARPRLHVLLRRGGGVARGRAHRDGLRRHAGGGVRQRPDRRRDRDAHRLGGRRLPRRARQPRLPVRGALDRARGDVRGRVAADARHRLHQAGAP